MVSIDASKVSNTVGQMHSTVWEGALDPQSRGPNRSLTTFQFTPRPLTPIRMTITGPQFLEVNLPRRGPNFFEELLNLLRSNVRSLRGKEIRVYCLIINPESPAEKVPITSHLDIVNLADRDLLFVEVEDIPLIPGDEGVEGERKKKKQKV